MSTKRTPKQSIDPTAAKAAILAAVREAKEPLKAAQIAKQREISKGLSGPKINDLLDPELKSGHIFNWGTQKTPAYWHRDQESEIRERLLSISAAEVLPAAELLRRAAAGTPKLSLPVVRKVQTGLVKEDRLRIVENEKKVVSTQHPELYLETSIAELLKSWGRELPSGRIRALFSDAPQPVETSESVAEVADKLFAAMNRIAFAPGTTVTFYRLRQQPELANIPKAIFDAAALLLQSERKALLSVHDHASALLPEERERFVTDGLGTYYVSIYSR